MPEQLETPLTHRVIESPLGRLLHSRVFERLKISSVDREFGVLRARAAADVAGEDVDAFLDELGVTDPIDDSLRRKIETTLQHHSTVKSEYESVADRWDEVFWGDTESTLDERTRLEKRRREYGSRWVSPQKEFKFITKADIVDIVDFDIPSPQSAIERWRGYDGSDVYGPPESMPDVAVSRTMRGPETREYLVRFESPSAFFDDTAYARVYEPADSSQDDELPTIIFATGLAMACDLMEYWTEEEYVGRDLAPQGYRVVLPIPPWHGRREIPGYYTGEPYLARMPSSGVELYEGQAKEIAVLVQWLRSQGAPTVGVGGLSLGGIVTSFVAAYADTWPSEMQPDFAIPVAASAKIADLLFESSLTKSLGVTGALEAAGWTRDEMSHLDSVLTAPTTPGLDPDRIYPVGGLVDEMTQYPTMRQTLDEWGVPAENRLEWDCGHFGVTLRAMRTDTFQEFLIDALETHSEDGPVQ
ncbi:alpha/beta hydrolase [Haloferax sp. MBLA0076]|uniref:Alpha/beta hydrolase n=1 Tax=Haloferax litoreum TaxID=2666140 RepID=A0A6A8GK15_9EURY|nr:MULTISPECIES: alpha/beta hydrolase [Haloferax]KAB1190377.1 alpha/beta hydrolase [Haloferax sp. CBA1148]MRX23346.1 alpha/beta hydrolase [Haloferax litoreum]